MKVNIRTRALAMLLAFVMAFALLPAYTQPALAAGPETHVNVIVENNTYSVDDGAPWEGVLFNTWVEYTAGDSMMDAVAKAFTQESVTAQGLASNYITEINGLAAMDGGFESGWMGTHNDWFTNDGFQNIDVSPGDQVHMRYTCDYGVDIGGDFFTDGITSLAGLSFSAGSLAPAFDPDTTAYTLTLPAGSTEVVVTPTALYKNYQVRTYLGATYTASDPGYKRTQNVPVTDGAIINVVCGDPSWPSMNAPGTATEYKVTVEIEAEEADYSGYMKITIPQNGTMTLGTKVRHYYPYTPASKIAGPISNPDGTVSYYYDLNNGTPYTYEIQVPGKAKYAGTFSMSAAMLTSGMTVTADKITASADYISRSFTGNSYNVSDIFLTANAKGYLTLPSSGSYQIHPLRNWQAVEATITSTNTPIVEPTYHYKVYNISGSGVTPGDGSIITVDENGVVTATGTGIAIVLITYDALYEIVANSGGVFSAILPENTGTLVVGVGQNASSIQTNMTINETLNASSVSANKREGHNLDAELDVLYYLSDQPGAKYVFTPEVGTTVTLLRPQVSATEMTFSGNFGTEGVSENSGTYTLTLPEGRNIVRIAKGSDVTYQVITARKVAATITNQTDPGAPFEPGDQVRVVFDTLYHPVNKLAAIYNFSASARYTTESGTAANGAGNQYTFASTANCQTINFTIPADWTGNTFSLLNGTLLSSGYGGHVGSHREIDWVNGHSASFAASMRTAYMGALPDVTVNVLQPTPVQPTVAIEFEKDYYQKGEDVVAKVMVYDVDVFNMAGYSVHYNNVMTFKSASPAMGFDLMPLSIADKNNAIVARMIYADPGTTGGDGAHIDTITFTMVESGKPELEFVTVNSIDFSSKSVLIINNGVDAGPVGTVTYALSVSADMLAAAAVDALIEAIGTVTLARESAINAARTAYDALSDGQKSYVTKLADLEAAEAAYARLLAGVAAGAVDDLIAQIGTVNPGSKAAIEAAREAYDNLTSEEKSLVDLLDVLELAEAKYELWTQGDANFDGIINSYDMSVLLSSYGLDIAACDFNFDGEVNSLDFSILLTGYGNKLGD